jgi:hypothetical protein
MWWIRVLIPGPPPSGAGIAEAVVVGGLVALAVVAGWRSRTAFGRRLSSTIALTSGAWLAALLALWTDFGDADGYADCWPSCSAIQRTVPTVLVVAGTLLPLYAVLLVGRLVLGRRRSSAAGNAATD